MSVIHGVLPSESVAFESGDDADDGGEFGEASAVVAKIFQFFRCAMQRSTADRIAEIV